MMRCEKCVCVLSANAYGTIVSPTSDNKLGHYEHFGGPNTSGEWSFHQFSMCAVSTTSYQPSTWSSLSPNFRLAKDQATLKPFSFALATEGNHTTTMSPNTKKNKRNLVSDFLSDGDCMRSDNVMRMQFILIFRSNYCVEETAEHGATSRIGAGNENKRKSHLVSSRCSWPEKTIQITIIII